MTAAGALLVLAVAVPLTGPGRLRRAVRAPSPGCRLPGDRGSAG
ncbi:hypothetical protein [Streptomyces sp. NPDC048295]